MTALCAGIALIPLSLWGVFAGLKLAAGDFEGAALWLATPLNAVLLALLLVAALIHLQGAVQVVIEDYIQKFTTKSALVILNIFVCVLSGFLGVFSILKVALTGAF